MALFYKSSTESSTRSRAVQYRLDSPAPRGPGPRWRSSSRCFLSSRALRCVLLPGPPGPLLQLLLPSVAASFWHSEVRACRLFCARGALSACSLRCRPLPPPLSSARPCACGGPSAVTPMRFGVTLHQTEARSRHPARSFAHCRAAAVSIFLHILVALGQGPAACGGLANC